MPASVPTPKSESTRKSEPARLYLITPVVEDVAAFRPMLERAVAPPVECVLLRFAASVRRDDRAALVQVVQARGAAALVEAEPREAARIKADGVHLPAADAQLDEALRVLKPDGIVGVGALTSRDIAMTAGEADVDYLMFGEPRQDGYVPPLLTTLDQTRWWAEIFNVPCVAYAERLDDVWPLVEAGAEFVALSDAVWADPRGPEQVVASLRGVLSRKAFA